MTMDEFSKNGRPAWVRWDNRLYEVRVLMPVGDDSHLVHYVAERPGWRGEDMGTVNERQIVWRRDEPGASGEGVAPVQDEGTGSGGSLV